MGLFSFPLVVAAGPIPGTIPDLAVEAIPKQRKPLVTPLFHRVHVFVAEARLVCVTSKASCVALFQQVPGLQERDGCSRLAWNGAV